jgi:phosphatidate phosphatase PAH1
MVDDFGWDVVAAYGNATTDIGAYAAAGIPTNRTFIVGEFGGQGGTVAIESNDFSAHIAGFVRAQPDDR